MDTIGNWGEVDSIKHCEKRLPLKSHSFRERSYFPRIWFWDLRFRIWGFEIKHLKAHNIVWQGCFFFHYYLAISMTNWAQMFTQFFFFFSCTCWDTPSEKTGLWQLPIVSIVFLNLMLYTVDICYCVLLSVVVSF